MHAPFFAHRRRIARLLRAGLVLALAGMPLAASAAYKCPTPGGHFTYQDVPCEQPDTAAATPAPAPDPAPAPPPPAPAVATPAPAAATPAPAAATAPAQSTAPTTAAAPARPAPEPYLGDDQGNPDAPGDTTDNGDAQASDDSAAQGNPNDQADAADIAAAKASLKSILARLALQTALWLGLAAYVGYRATLRNRGFFKWSILALVFSPALIYLILRVMGPADEMA